MKTNQQIIENVLYKMSNGQLRGRNERFIVDGIINKIEKFVAREYYGNDI